MKDVKGKLVVVTHWMEIVVSILLIIAIVIAGILVSIDIFTNMSKGFYELEYILNSALTLVVGIEFVKMLVLHTPESVLEVLLYAVARQVVMSHDSALENLLGVLAVGVIFVIRKYFVSKKVDAEASRG